jgi:uncharacterized protein (DUF2249 family)
MTGSRPSPELDLRGVPARQRHPQVYAMFETLAVGQSVTLVDDDDPIHLREQMERDLHGSFSWEYSRREPQDWRITITRMTSTPLPRVVVDSREACEPDAVGALWRLDPSERDLDANLIALPPGESIREHVGADLDVLLHVVDGAGTLRTEGADVPLRPGAVVYLPRRARRAVLAGSQGLRYLSVHRRKETLPLMPTLAPGT